jgi:very-short-patch-repair endonuclease
MNDHDRALLAFAAQQYFLVTRQQAQHLGLPSHVIDWRLASGFLESVFHEVYRIAGMPSSWRQRVKAATLAGGDGAVASHDTARALWQLPGSSRIGPIHVTIPRGHNHTVPGVIAHEARQLEPVDITTLFGIKVTTADRTAFDLAWSLDPLDLLNLIDDITGRGLATSARMKVRSKQLGGRGVAGTKRFREVLDVWIEDGKVSMTKFERRLFTLFDGADVPRPIPQFVVRTRLGVKKFDYAFTPERLGLEAHSRKHHGDELIKPGDIDRHDLLTATGYRVLYVRWRDMVYRPQWVIDNVSEALANSHDHHAA